MISHQKTNGIWGSPQWWATASWVEWGGQGLRGGAHLWCSWGFAGLGGAHCGLAGSLAWFPTHNQDHMLWKTVRKRERPKNKLNHRKPPNQTTYTQNNQKKTTTIDKASEAQVGRVGWCSRKPCPGGTIPLVQNLQWQFTARLFSLLFKVLSAQVSTFLSCLSSYCPLFSSHTGLLRALPNLTMLCPPPPPRIFAIALCSRCKGPPLNSCCLWKTSPSFQAQLKCHLLHKAVPYFPPTPRVFCWYLFFGPCSTNSAACLSHVGHCAGCWGTMRMGKTSAGIHWVFISTFCTG